MESGASFLSRLGLPQPLDISKGSHLILLNNSEDSSHLLFPGHSGHSRDVLPFLSEPVFRPLPPLPTDVGTQLGTLTRRE